MGTRESADFYEAFKRHREQERSKTRKPDVESSRPAIPEDGNSPSEPVPDSPGDELPDCMTSSPPEAEDTASSIYVEAPGHSGPSLAPDAFPDGPRIVSMRFSTLASGLAIVCLGFVGAYVLGRVHGPAGLTTLLPSGDNPALSATEERKETPELAAPARSDTAQQPTAATSETAQPEAAAQSGKQYILVLSTYSSRSETMARTVLQKLLDQGYEGLALAKDGRFIYLYYGPCPSAEDPKLKEHKAAFSGQKEFKDCFVKSVVMK
jgi:hypothetical protein